MNRDHRSCLLLSLAPDFSRVSARWKLSSRFNGFGDWPLRHYPVGKPLKRLSHFTLPDTRLKPGAHETADSGRTA